MPSSTYWIASFFRYEKPPIRSVDDLFKEAKQALDEDSLRPLHEYKEGSLEGEFDAALKECISDHSSLETYNRLHTLVRNQLRVPTLLLLWLPILLIFAIPALSYYDNLPDYSLPSRPDVVAVLVSISAVLVAFVARNAKKQWRNIQKTDGQLAGAIRRLNTAVKDECPELVLNSIKEKYHLHERPWRLEVPMYGDVNPCKYLVERHDDYGRTRAFGVVADYVKTHDRGSIGIAGERGAGKTSLMRHLERILDSDHQSIHTVWMAAPTKIEEKEFLLSVLAKTASSVGVKLTHNKYWPGSSPRAQRCTKLCTNWLVFVTYILLFYFIVSNIPRHLQSSSVPRHAYDEVSNYLVSLQIPLLTSWGGSGIMAMVLGIFVLVVIGIRHLDTKRKRSKTEKLTITASKSLLEELWYERKHTVSSNVGFAGIPIVGRFGTEKKRQPFTLPHLVDLWQQYVEFLTADDRVFEKVVVFVDEIDKLKGNHKVEDCMLILKALYKPDNLMFVVSISEDAYDVFRKRISSQHQRNPFDSSVDHVEWIERASLEELGVLINGKMLGHPFSTPVIQLIWMASMGNPRDAIRLARRIPSNKRSRDLADIALDLCSEVVCSIAEAGRSRVDGSQATGDALRELCNFSVETGRESSAKERENFASRLTDAVKGGKWDNSVPCLLTAQLRYTNAIWMHFVGDDKAVESRCRALSEKKDCRTLVEQIHHHLSRRNAREVEDLVRDYLNAVGLRNV